VLLSTCASAGAGNHTGGLEDAEDLVSGDDCKLLARAIDYGVAKRTLGLGNAVRVAEDLANPASRSVCHCAFFSRVSVLRGSGALLRKLGDLLDDLLGGGLEPRRRAARVGDGRGRYALSVAVKTTHVGEMYWRRRGRLVRWREDRLES
jgi:hypothetical protein